MADENTKPKYRLVICDKKDSACMRKAVDYLVKQFPLCKDSEFRLIDGQEYQALVDAEAISYSDCWKISVDRVGCISLMSYARYTETWNRITTAFGDFCEGYASAVEDRKGGIVLATNGKLRTVATRSIR